MDIYRDAWEEDAYVSDQKKTVFSVQNARNTGKITS